MNIFQKAKKSPANEITGTYTTLMCKALQSLKLSHAFHPKTKAGNIYFRKFQMFISFYNLENNWTSV